VWNKSSMSYRNRLIASFAAGLIFAFLTWSIIGGDLSPLSVGPEFRFLFGIISILLIPGMFLGFILSRNVHIVNIWLIVMGNFMVYSGVAFLVLTKRWKRRSNRQEEMGGET
jgi:hypothetical protein